MLNVQLYYGLQPKDLVLGEIKDPASGEDIIIDILDFALYPGQIFKSATQLTPRDAELVAKVFIATHTSNTLFLTLVVLLKNTFSQNLLV